jgi:hypothetical protein
MGGVYVQDASNLRRTAHRLPLSRPWPILSTFSQHSQAISEKANRSVLIAKNLPIDNEEAGDRPRELFKFSGR